MPTVAARNFHVPLPVDVDAALRRESARTGRPATAIAREAIELHLRRLRRLALHEAIAAYATEHAGGDADLDRELERAATEHLLDPEDA